ncbi:RagB/SusD family nutrient uptake outer membrane protein [uncultured Flavobacterium sp.]|uniref:RagB/SusD family nutrient uptake outer membrane protein n=1 Tax=uncultured Flavobacterium sp. TaxID=165435 RepID=UPI0025CE223C|nr:RagB/SusD family nutrient uptake outer membrane protein [uncultured Flavobacterium sp.]
MKKYIKTLKFALVFGTIVGLASCSEEFLNRPPEDNYSVDTFYNTDQQLEAATNGLYGKIWFNYHNKAFYAIGEIASGNGFSYSSDVNSLKELNANGGDPEIANAWMSCWAVVAQSNALINLLPERIGSGVSEAAYTKTMGELKFMRALAYFYIVRLWGPVPIIENNLEFINRPEFPSNRVEDVYTFIENDLQFAIENLPAKMRGSNYADNAHVSKGSAKAILAKVYLTQNKYAQARAMAEEVINSGEFKLYGGTQLPAKSYGDLFLTSNDNNEESIMAFQWTNGAYGTGNSCNTQFAYSSYINENTYGGVFAPSQDLMTIFETGDIRRKETYMLPGDFYPNITTADGPGLTVPNNIDAQVSGAGLKKYVVGKVSQSAGPMGSNGMMANNTYVMRYADLLLIHAEAILGDAASTSDSQALSSLNAVRNRAGLGNKVSFTKDEILHERRVELAYEGEYWFDLCRIPRAKAIAMVQAQNRGDKNFAVYLTGVTESDFVLPYPSGEVIKNPMLAQPPVPYNFN